jgi:hypothetical protein
MEARDQGHADGNRPADQRLAGTCTPGDAADRRYEIDCWVADPGGTESKGRMGTHKFRAYASYPGAFDGAAKVVPGTYTVIWREQKPPGAGKWRVIDAARVTVRADDMQYPPATAGITS